MTDIGFLLSGTLFFLLAGLGVWLRLWTERMKAENARLRNETDWDALRRGYDLRKLRASVSVYDYELEGADDPEAKMVRARRHVVESVVRELIDQGYIRLLRSDVPAKPDVEFTASLIVSRPPTKRGVSELDNVTAEELLWERNEPTETA
jgi:hypothetical protein